MCVQGGDGVAPLGFVVGHEGARAHVDEVASRVEPTTALPSVRERGARARSSDATLPAGGLTLDR